MRVARIVLPAVLWLNATAYQHAWGQEIKDTKPEPQLIAAKVVSESGTTLPEAPAPISVAVSAIPTPVAKPALQTVRQKFIAYTKETFGPLALAAPAFHAGLVMANPPRGYPREWRRGAAAFGRNYGDQLARNASMHTARFSVGALVHEDFRYRASDSKHAFARAGYALVFTLADRSDSGHTRFALANFAGAAAGGYIPNLYLPRGFNDVSHADTRMMLMLGGMAVSNLRREFEPEINHFVKGMHLPRIAGLERLSSREEER